MNFLSGFALIGLGGLLIIRGMKQNENAMEGLKARLIMTGVASIFFWFSNNF